MSEPGPMMKYLDERRWLADADMVHAAREQDSALAALTRQRDELIAGLEVAHEFCCDEEEGDCTPDNCQIAGALNGKPEAAQAWMAATRARKDTRIAELEAALRVAARIVSDRAAGGRMIIPIAEARVIWETANAALAPKEEA